MPVIDATHFFHYDIFSTNGICMTVPGENTWSRKPQNFSGKCESGHLAGCGEEGYAGMFKWDFGDCFLAIAESETKGSVV